jgi:hypothetical protein
VAGIAVLIIGLWVLFIAVMANVTAWAWNMVIVDMFHGPGPIDGWQGFAINVLLSLIFGRNSVTFEKKGE